MRVTANYEAYVHQPKTTTESHVQHRPKESGNDKEFADMFAHRHGKPEHSRPEHGRHEPEKGGSKSIYPDIAELNLRMSSVHRFGATQIKPDKEWLNTVGQPNAESKGDKELTGSQILFLQSHYDVENLTSVARNNLLCDLTDMGVLSAADLSSDDQSKVDDVLEQIKAFKMGVLTYVEFPEQPELIMIDKDDFSDPELRGLSDDEKFAAIFKKYDGGTTIDSFHQMTSALYRNKLLTWEQSKALFFLADRDYSEKRKPLESMPGFTMAQGKQFHANYRVSMNDLFKQAAKINPVTVMGLDRQLHAVDMSFLREFASKFDALSKESIT